MHEFEPTDRAEGDAQQAPHDGIAILADLASTFTFASHQNSIPVVRSIRIENLTASSVENARLELTASPAFLRAKTWAIDRIMAGEGLTLSDRRIDLDAGYLAGLDEAERGDIKLRLLKGNRVLAETIVPVRLLARDEWGGVSDMAQLLPAFIMPNDPAIFRVLRSAAERLAGHGHSSALDGYQSNDPKRAYMLAAAVYSPRNLLAIRPSISRDFSLGLRTANRQIRSFFSKFPIYLRICGLRAFGTVSKIRVCFDVLMNANEIGIF